MKQLLENAPVLTAQLRREQVEERGRQAKYPVTVEDGLVHEMPLARLSGRCETSAVRHLY